MQTTTNRDRLFYAAAAIVVLLALGWMAYMVLQQQASARAAAQSTECKTTGQNHGLSLANDAFSQPALQVNRCDTITVTNADNQLYDLAFGKHDHHLAYSGFTEQTLAPQKSLVISARQAGSYEIHDHLRDKAVLELQVNSKP